MKNETIAAALAFVMLCVLVLFGDAYGGSGTADAETVWTAEITLTGDTAEWTGDGVTLEDGVLTLGGSGTYRLTGTWQEGCIVVEAGKKGYVTLVLDGLDVSSSTGSALEIASCSRVTVLTAEGSENRLKSTAQGDDAASALVTKADLLLDGAGSLTLVSAGKHGVQAADSLTVSGGTLAIKAAKAGLRANDFILISDGGISVTAGEDGLHADGDESKPDTGWIEIAGGSLVICAGDDGVHAETKLTVSGGSLTVTESYEGLEAEEIVILSRLKGWSRRRAWNLRKGWSRRRTWNLRKGWSRPGVWTSRRVQARKRAGSRGTLRRAKARRRRTARRQPRRSCAFRAGPCACTQAETAWIPTGTSSSRAEPSSWTGRPNP